MIKWKLLRLVRELCVRSRIRGAFISSSPVNGYLCWRSFASYLAGVLIAPWLHVSLMAGDCVWQRAFASLGIAVFIPARCTALFSCLSVHQSCLQLTHTQACSLYTLWFISLARDPCIALLILIFTHPPHVPRHTCSVQFPLSPSQQPSWAVGGNCILSPGDLS